MLNKHLSIGVDIGGTHVTCAAVDLRSGEMLGATRSRVVCDHASAPEVIFQRWAEALNGALTQVDGAQLAGIGFAIPGPFEYRNGISRMQHKFKSLYGVHIPTALNELLPPEAALPMRFVNDATAFAIGEAWRGEGYGFRKVVVITLGTGFGSAFVEDGAPVVTGGQVPREGCLWHLPFRDGIADEYFSTRWFERAYRQHTGASISGVKALMERAGADAFVHGLFAQFGRNLAECLAPWLRLFGAEVLVIGGNIAHALPLFGADFQAGLQSADVSVKTAPSKLGEDAALLGSARLFDEAFWEKVSVSLPHI